MAKTHFARKEKRTFSLSRESVQYLEAAQRRNRGQSISSVLEDVIRRQREAQEMERISASVSSYYDSLTDEQVADDQAWGEFAETQFSAKE